MCGEDVAQITIHILLKRDDVMEISSHNSHIMLYLGIPLRCVKTVDHAQVYPP